MHEERDGSKTSTKTFVGVEVHTYNDSEFKYKGRGLRQT